MTTRRTITTAATTTAAIAALTLSLLGCAPEPIAGAPQKGAEVTDDTGWAETTDPDDVSLKSTVLPDGFPSAAFALPEGAVIDDAGERSGTWFVVLRAVDEAEADRWWAEILTTNSLSSSDEQEGGDGSSSATLHGGTVEILAVRTAPQPDGSILLSYDITPIVL